MSTFFSCSCSLELHQEFVDHPQDDILIKRLKRNDGVQPISELGREHSLDVAHFIACLLVLHETDRSALQRFGTRIGRHDG